MYRCKHFKIEELVSPIVFNTYGQFAWSFFDENILKDLDLLRELTGGSLTINNWSWNGIYRESGLRCNMDSLVAEKTRPYLSAHVLGRGFDLKSKIMSSKELYSFILENQHKFKAINRIENIRKTSSWVHVDSMNTDSDKISIF